MRKPEEFQCQEFLESPPPCFLLTEHHQSLLTVESRGLNADGHQVSDRHKSVSRFRSSLHKKQTFSNLTQLDLNSKREMTTRRKKKLFSKVEEVK